MIEHDLLVKYKKNGYLLLIISVLSVITWHPILQLIPQSVSFFYLVKSMQQYYWHSAESLTTFGLGAVLLGKLFTGIFKTEFVAYYLIELLVILAINILFFSLVLKLTKKNIIAFTATLIFATSYFGNWDMYAGGIYAYFMERVPNMLFLIPSLLLLHFYLERSNVKFYLGSLSFYFFGVAFFHWSILFTAPYLFYPFFWKFFQKRNLANVSTGLLIGMSYVSISALFVFIQGIFDKHNGPPGGFIDFLLHPFASHYPDLMLRQLAYWSEYSPLIKGLNFGVGGSFKYIQTPLHYLIPVQNAIEIMPYVLIAYLLAIIIIYKKLPQFKVLLLTIVFALLSTFFLNVFFGQYQVATQPGSSRYLYFPSFLLAIFWGLFLYSLVQIFNRWKYISVLLIILIYYSVNTWLIWQHFIWTLEFGQPARNIWEFLIKQRPQLPLNATVIIDSSKIGHYEIEFLNDRLSKGEITYILSSKDKDIPIGQNSYKVGVKHDIKNNQIVEKRIE